MQFLKQFAKDNTAGLVVAIIAAGAIARAIWLETGNGWWTVAVALAGAATLGGFAEFMARRVAAWRARRG